MCVFFAGMSGIQSPGDGIIPGFGAGSVSRVLLVCFAGHGVEGGMASVDGITRHASI